MILIYNHILNFNYINFYIVFNIKIKMLSDKNCKILCLLFAIIIIGLLIRAFTNQGKLWGNENYRSTYDKNQPCNGPMGFLCDIKI